MGRGGGAAGGKPGRGGRGFSSHRSSAGGSSGRRTSSGGSMGSLSSHRKSSAPRNPSPPRGSWGSSAPRNPPPPRRSWDSPPPRRSWGPPPGGYGGQRTGRGCCGNFFLIVLLLAVILAAFFASLRSEKVQNFVRDLEQVIVPDDNRRAEDNGKAEKQTAREKLAAEKCLRTEQMIQDDLHWLSDTGTVKQAMEEFYEKTGVQPYLYICDRLNGKGEEITDEEAESYLEEKYNAMYQDEGHMIFVFMEYAASEYITYLYTGTEASVIINDDAREVFLTNADTYYTDSSLSDEAYFARVFRESAKQIMK